MGLAPLVAHQAHQPHAAHALDGDHEVHRTEHRPPAVAQAVHPGKTLQPLLGPDRRPPAAEASGLDLEAQQAQPVAQSPVADELSGTRQVQAFCSPPKPRLRRRWPARWRRPHRLAGLKPAITTRPSGTSTRSTSRSVRCGSRASSSACGNTTQVDAGIGKRQRLEVAMQADRLERRLHGDHLVQRRRHRQRFGHHQRIAGHPAVRHAVGAQALEFGQAQLHGMETEGVGHRMVEPVLLPGQQVAARRSPQPGPQLYNRLVSRHDESDRPARLRRQLHLDASRRRASRGGGSGR